MRVFNDSSKRCGGWLLGLMVESASENNQETREKFYELLVHNHSS
jgi:hypothetical protein